MDKIQGLASKLGGGKGQEFVDKGFKLMATGVNAAEQKFGGGGDSNPAKKVTDTGREQLDKAGYDFPRHFPEGGANYTYRKDIPNKFSQ
ncbi:hypothetical protein N7491_011216 [Penicillium cf. griseofulvum]|uniref:Uncharacterized protein n=1 Tax=Penicillium cf. griseofulvum TaxID=2972120 RepID=A0A9W9T6J6_9EURO|nr:hypothetical protein N7472_001536 [Penicillium cf. griseofulvum]KAJ5422771.1 hypothetical protein N7491_011216 [Penicillium cf. griseofulvum]KAJ5428949.1 hypothetical protein N7445_010403 [Penicillium cf. griseofulvum]